MGKRQNEQRFLCTFLDKMTYFSSKTYRESNEKRSKIWFRFDVFFDDFWWFSMIFRLNFMIFHEISWFFMTRFEWRRLSAACVILRIDKCVAKKWSRERARARARARARNRHKRYFVERCMGSSSDTSSNSGTNPSTRHELQKCLGQYQVLQYPVLQYPVLQCCSTV